MEGRILWRLVGPVDVEQSIREILSAIFRCSRADLREVDGSWVVVPAKNADVLGLSFNKMVI